MTTDNVQTITLNPRTPMWLSAYGLILILGGILCFLLPKAAGVGVEIVMAISLLLAGALHLAISSSVAAPAKMGFILAGVIELILALLILTHPMTGLFALTIYIGVALILQGISRMFLVRRLGGANHHIFWFLSAICGVLIGAFIVFSFKSTALWLPGTLVGISFVMTGVATFLVGRSLKLPA